MRDTGDEGGVVVGGIPDVQPPTGLSSTEVEGLRLTGLSLIGGRGNISKPTGPQIYGIFSSQLHQ